MLCYIKHLAVHGIVKIGDLISDDGRFLESEKLLEARLSPVHLFELMAIFNFIVFYARSRPKERTKTYNKELCRVS